MCSIRSAVICVLHRQMEGVCSICRECSRRSLVNRNVIRCLLEETRMLEPPVGPMSLGGLLGIVWRLKGFPNLT